ncbi:MAG TPA: T9SS type A sorting domain-containing protein [Candidatus Syntrophosphaera sp.]|nr:T9SS type A sorting domain-containing protein [Candidatus Syntrophosphaera sp.]
MKKALLSGLLLLTAAMSWAILVETASLSAFLTGSEPNCAYDRWISHLAEGIAIPNYNVYAPWDVQTNGFGDFRIPTVTDLFYWNNMLDLFCAEDYDGAQAVLDSNAAPFQIVEFHDTDTGRTYYMIREIPNLTYFDDNGTIATYDDETGAFAYGWGLYIFNPEGTEPIIITIPHCCDDFPTPRFGLEALEIWNPKYLLINGAGREVRWTNEGTYTNSKSISDPTRYAAHPFNTAYKKFADKIRDQFQQREWSCQLHSYDWNLHLGYANCQISAGNPRSCPNLPIRDLSPLKHDLINAGHHLMIPANTIGVHDAVYLNDFYTVNYSLHDFTFSDGEQTYPVNNYMDLPAYQQNQQMVYTQSGTTDYDVYEPFFHMEMDELPSSYAHNDHVYDWFYGWDEATQTWNMDHLFDNFIAYYGRWLYDIEPVLVETFNMDNGQGPAAPTNLAVFNQSMNNVTLSWTKGSDYEFDSYEVLYATEPIGIDNYQVFNRSNASFLASPDCERITVTSLVNSNQYYFRLRAKDKNGNVSTLSNEANTILAPANITSLTAHGLDDKVRVYWQVGGQTNNQGFSVYRCQNQGDFILADSWQTNPALANATASTFEWWDNNVSNGLDYTYKISSTNLNNIEFFYNYPASASPRPIHFITIRNSTGALADSIAFGANPYATDGNDGYWDITKGNPSSTYVWNAFWEQYWGTSGTQLAREIKGFYDPDSEIKTWTMRTRSDQLETLTISASDNFDRSEKLYLLDGGSGTYFNLLSGSYNYTNANSNIRTMTLFWGNMQPKVLHSMQDNRVFQGSSTINFFWNYQYPFLIDHIELSVINATDSLLINASLPNNQYSYSYLVPQNILEMQDCRLAADVVAVDGVRTRFWSDYHFSLVPLMTLAYNEPGWKTRTDPWVTGDLSIEQVFGTGAVAYQRNQMGGWTLTTDYDFGNSYWVYSPEVSFYSNTNAVQSNEYSFDLVPGWNFIPNPHLCAYDIEDLCFYINGNLFRYSELLAQELVSRAVYVSRNNLYAPVTRIEPWEALLIKFYGSADVVPQIRFYPFFAAPPIDPSPANWSLKVDLAQAGAASQLLLGAHDMATDSYDFRYDLPTCLASPVPRPTLSFPVAESDSLALETSLYSDFRVDFSEPEQQKFWNFNLDVPSTEPVVLTFEQSGIQVGWQIMLLLNDTPYFVGSSESFTWTPPAAGSYSGYIRVSNYAVGVDDLVQSPLSGLAAWPNPFNPDVNIAFNLASGTSVKVEVFNIRGQKVASLSDGKMAGGRHTLVWNGKDSTGRNVGSGLYFARVRTPQKTQTIKMMLMK